MMKIMISISVDVVYYKHVVNDEDNDIYKCRCCIL